MQLKDILTDLTSNILIKEINAIKYCFVNETLLSNKKILREITGLLNHDEFKLREATELLIKYYIKFHKKSDEDISKILIGFLDEKEYDADSWLRCTKLMSLLPVSLEILDQFINVLNKDFRFAQGFVTEFLRDLFRKFPEMLASVLDLSRIEGSDAKKAICWLFWENPSLVSHQTLQFLATIAEDEDYEVRSFTCEILASLITIEEYRFDVIKILETKIMDDSWFVAKVAIRCLLQKDFGVHSHELQQEYPDKILSLFWHSDWVVRKNFCEVIPLWLPLERPDCSSFLELMIASLDDDNWEVRESAIISINKHLDLKKEEFYGILETVSNMVDDPHEDVRKTVCNVICDRLTAFRNIDEIILKIIRLMKDQKWEVREEALEIAMRLFEHPIWDKYFDMINLSLLALIVDGNDDVRKKAWIIFNQARNLMTEAQIADFLANVEVIFNHTNPQIRFSACDYLRNSESLWFVPASFYTLLEDDDPHVLTCAWDTVSKHIEFFKRDTHFLAKYINNTKHLSNKQIIPFCMVLSRTKLIHENDFLIEILKKKLLELKNIELRNAILAVFSRQKLHSLLVIEDIVHILNEGQWVVQEALIPFIVHHLLVTNKKFQQMDVQDIINDILSNPITKFRSRIKESYSILEPLYADILKEFNDPGLGRLFDIENDDVRFENWVNIENKFDLLEKTSHPKTAEIEEEFILELENVSQNSAQLGYDRILTQKIDLQIPRKVMTIMFYQYEPLRLKLLMTIRDNITFTAGLNQKIETTIISELLDDSSIKIRSMAWKLAFDKLIIETGLESTIIERLLNLSDSTFTDVRVKAISVLLKHVDLTKPENESVLLHLLTKFTDISFLIRNQIWQFIKENIDLADPASVSLLERILKLYPRAKPELKKEIQILVKERINILIPILDNLPESVDFYILFGSLYYKLGEYYTAIDYYNKAIDLDPLILDSLLGKALSLYKQEEFDEAIQVLDVARKNHPFYSEVYVVWVDCLRGLGRNEEANMIEIKAVYLFRMKNTINLLEGESLT